MHHFFWLIELHPFPSRPPVATASLVSDCISNSARVVKVYKQAAADAGMTYGRALREIVAADGVVGLMTRGLGTKLAANAVQGALFSVLWRLGMDALAHRDKQ